jgi:hypothetical protein
MGFFLVFIFAFSIAFSQTDDKQMQGSKPLEKIQQWEKAKLIELLNLKEENSVKFFARRNDHQNKMKEILDQRDQFMKDLSKELHEGTKQNDNTYRDKLYKLLSFESRLMKEKEAFLKSLNDVLTPEQILKLSVFEIKFRKELREKLIERNKNK